MTTEQAIAWLEDRIYPVIITGFNTSWTIVWHGRVFTGKTLREAVGEAAKSVFSE